jgi:hypothetical protein
MTNKQRLALYKKALDDFKNKRNHSNYGFCNYFYQIRNLDIFDEYDFEKILPELYKQKPQNRYAFWFDTLDRESRVECLKNAIKLITKP